MNTEQLAKIAQEIDNTEITEYRGKEYEIYETKFCLGLTLYFYNGLIDNKPGILHFYDKMFSFIDKKIFTYFLVDGRGTYKKVNKDTFNLLPFWAKTPEERIRRSLDLESGVRESMSDTAFKYYAFNVPNTERVGAIRLLLPYDTLSRVGVEKYIDMVLELCREMNFMSGNVGFTVNRDDELSSYSHQHTQLWANSRRYWGLDPDYFANSIHPFNYCDRVTEEQKTIHSIRRVDWLTFLNHRLIDKLGGLEHLTAQLTAGEWGAGIVIHPLPQGICIQAGPEPDIGDVNTNEEMIMPYYHHVGKILKPVTILQNEYGYDVNDLRISVVGSREDTAEWLTRFD